MNLKLEEIAALTSPLERALALTWSQLNFNDLRVRFLIQSVDVPAAGPAGAELQKCLKPTPKPASRHRKKASVKRLHLWSSIQDDGNLFELIADQPDAQMTAGTKSMESVDAPAGAENSSLET